MPAGGAQPKSKASGTEMIGGGVFQTALDGEDNMEERDHREGNRLYFSDDVPQQLIEEMEEQFPGIDKATAEALGQSIYGFSRGFDSYMNNSQQAWLEGKELTDWGEMALNRAAWVENYIEKSPKFDSSKPLYRGLNSKDIRRYFENANPGDIYTPGRLSSASSYMGTAEAFATKRTKANSVILEIEGPHKTAASIRHISHFPEENEVMFSARSALKIISKYTDKDGILHVKAKSGAPDKTITEKLRKLRLKPVNNKADVEKLGKIDKKNPPPLTKTK
ncbi:MAG: hypothetical protein LBQ42_09020 [Synergistaceae bacterium]|jgi:hypothetical protein|nr:hypothetical protein [Synergistaceae bacterium]